MDGEESVIVGAADADIVAQTARVGSGVVALGLLQQQRRLVQRGSFVLVPGDDDLFVVLQPALTVKKNKKKRFKFIRGRSIGKKMPIIGA